MFPASDYKRRPLFYDPDLPLQRGHDVWALQINLNNLGPVIEEDGIFGPQTEKAVTEYQKSRDGLEVDGVAGPQTERYMCIDTLRPAQARWEIPKGLPKGMAMGESAYDPAAVSFFSVESHHQIDCGWLGFGVRDWIDAKFREAFDGAFVFEELCGRLRRKKDEFHKLPSDLTHRRAWELAVLFWNWQSAAVNYANGLENWTYYERIGNTLVPRKMDEPANWIIRVGVDGVETGHQWADHYVHTKTVLVAGKDWTH